MQKTYFNLKIFSLSALMIVLTFGNQNAIAQQTNKYLFVLAGQSNMVGSSYSAYNKIEEIGNEDWRNNTDIKKGGITEVEKKVELDFDYAIWTNKIPGRIKHWQVNWALPARGQFVNVVFGTPKDMREKAYMNDPVYNGLTGPTLGVSFAVQFLLNHSDPNAQVYLVGAATGSSGFSQPAVDWFKDNNAPTRTWSPYIYAKHNLQNGMIFNAKSAAASLGTVKIGGMLWLQGESDGSLTKWNYATAVQRMVYRFRTEVPGALYSTFYLATMMPQAGKNPNAKPPTFISSVDEAHRTIIPFYNDFYKTGVYNAKLVDTYHMNASIQKYQSPCERENPQPQCKNPDQVKFPYSSSRTHYSAYALRRIGRDFATLASQ